jgi:hypothetical protein
VHLAFRNKKGRQPSEEEREKWVRYLLKGGRVESMLKMLRCTATEVVESAPKDVVKLESTTTEGIYQGIVIQSGPATFMRAGMPAKVKVVIENRSELGWASDEDMPIYASYHWHLCNGKCISFDGIRTNLPRLIAPDASAEMDVHVLPPGRAGEYILELTLVHEGVCWLEERGFTPLQLLIPVQYCLPASTEQAVRELEWARHQISGGKEPTLCAS